MRVISVWYIKNILKHSRCYVPIDVLFDSSFFVIFQVSTKAIWNWYWFDGMDFVVLNIYNTRISNELNQDAEPIKIYIVYSTGMLIKCLFKMQ